MRMPCPIRTGIRQQPVRERPVAVSLILPVLWDVAMAEDPGHSGPVLRRLL